MPAHRTCTSKLSDMLGTPKENGRIFDILPAASGEDSYGVGF